MESKASAAGVGLDEVKQELTSILQSKVFAHSARQGKLLEYLCNKVLLGEAEHIKATTIAIEVFGRQWNFDESKDAIVRVEAHRLRRKLAKYYEEAGTHSRLRIMIPAGRYVPEFTCAEEAPEPPPPQIPPVLEPPPARPRRSPMLWLAAVVVLLATAGLLAMSIRRHESQTARATVTNVSAAASSNAGDIRFLAGQMKSTYVDRFGRSWEPDRYFHGGEALPGAKDFYGRPPDAGLFATMRSGEFSYDIPVPQGSYELRLYFAEPIFRLATETNGGGENERRFNVSLNGKDLLTNFDVVADSGISPVDIRRFAPVSPEADGKIHIRFQASYGTPFVNGIELLPVPDGRPLPIRIRAHDLSYTDHEGNVWSPDNYYIGGRFATHKEVVAGTPDSDLFAGERYGNFSYAIPVPDGKYAVTLYLAETWFRPDSDGQNKGGKGDRIFDVYCNGTTLLKDLDIFARVGPFQAYTRTFHAIRPNGQGKILLSFSPSRNYAAVKAIQVTAEP